ncbi:hscarg dehydrogenase protein [Pleurostoma richardsiae]|uniref:Hscarg dehydrogenase protein n=1 Tax=Pleurostoma richardsiae TaxID=41990 RepID=A0AA38VSL8_9PEZI|nr:hscarg dehydrogenase protein [Pleurostoma richardsiae]
MTTASSRKTIVVVGATGNQGSSVVNAFLKLPHWHVRALTRTPTSDASKSLAAQGAEVVLADLAEPASLTKAFEGANAIFLNTDFWGTYMPAKAALDAEGKPSEPASLKAFTNETTNGKNAVDAAAAVPTLERFIYSALAPIAKLSKGRYTRSMHSDAKAHIVDYIEAQQPAVAKKTSLIIPGAYTGNPAVTPRFDPDSGKYVLVTPLRADFRMPIINPRESVGPFVRALVEDEPAGTKLLAYDSYLTFTEMLDKWSKACGKDAVHVTISTKELHEKMGLPYELLDGLDFANEIGTYIGYDGVIEPYQLKTKIQTKSFDDWLKERDWDKDFSA